MNPEIAICAPIARPASKSRRGLTLQALVFVSPLLAAAVALFFGAYGLSPAEVLAALAAPLTGQASDAVGVVWDVRMPRIALAGLTGLALAGSGGTFQAAFRNPLVDPFLLGISAGAAFGCALAYGFLPSASVPLCAFAFGWLAVGLAFTIARAGGEGSPLALVLSGVVVSAFFTALVSIVKFFVDPHKLQAIVFWLMGSFSLAEWRQVKAAGLGVVVGMAPVLLLRWRLNVLSLGDEEAAALGVDAPRLRRWLVAAATLAVTSVVAVSGLIGWVGLMVPHLVRMAAGPDHRRLVPLSLAGGATVMIAADTVARSLTSFDLPVGIVTALAGAPFFVVLMAKGRQGWGS